jgi:hypothetical protein
MLTELIRKKDELCETTGANGDSYKFDLRAGTITDTNGAVVYSSPAGAKN